MTDEREEAIAICTQWLRWLQPFDSVAAALVLAASAVNHPLPEEDRFWVLQFLADQVSRKQRRGGDRLHNLFRDIQIAVAVWEVCKRFNLQPTRGRATRDLETRVSGSSIAAKACERLGHNRLSEDAIDKIWLRQSKRMDFRLCGTWGESAVVGVTYKGPYKLAPRKKSVKDRVLIAMQGTHISIIPPEDDVGNE
jgi:hypothetical protein